MNIIWFYSLVSVFIVSIISFIGIFTLSVKLDKLKKILLLLVSFAAGALLGDVFIHLLPEIIEKGFNLTSSLMILAGIVIFFVIEKIIYWRHCHIPASKNHHHHLGLMNLIGDGIHNFTDGVIIAAAFMVNINIGLATSLAVIFHEIPQEIGDFSVLIYAGFTKKKALIYNFAFSLFAFLGALLTLLIGVRLHWFIDYLIPITIGSFLYIATADLIPELKKEEKFSKSLLQLTSLLLGIFIMYLIK